MTDFFSQPDDYGEIRQSELHASLGERLGAQALDTLDPKNSLSGAWFVRRARESSAGGLDQAPGMNGEVDVFGGQPLEQQQAVYDAQRAAIPDTSIDEAKARVKQEGLDGHLKLPDQPSIKSPVLDMMISEAHERRDREAAIARGPQGFLPDALGVVTSLGAGMIDPVNMAAFSIPVLGEARMGKILASAGDNLFARAGVRALEGGVQGAVGTAVLQPADWWLHTQDGQDYTFADALKSVVMGAGMGAGFHAAIGGYGDVRARLRGAPLPGSPEDLLQRGLMTGRHVPADILHEDGVSADELEASFGRNVTTSPAAPAEPVPMHPAELLADLPPAAQEDVVKASIADVTADRPVRAAEMLQVSADHDPRIAESFDAYHGSPHDVGRFSAEHIGTGEGAQTYGHGLYFAENEKVALKYQVSTTGRDFFRKAQEFYDEFDRPDNARAAIAESNDFTPGQKRLLLALEKDDWLGFDYPHQAVSAALGDPNGKNWEMSPETLDAIKHVGNMYRVRIAANRDHFLDWDKSLSEQHPRVREAVARIVQDHSAFGGGRISGEDVYHLVASELATHKKGTPDRNGFYRMDDGRAAASSALSAAGIHGIKYLDKGSRGAGEGARNFVVFDDKHIEITHKNGEPVTLPKAPAPALADPDLVTAPKPRGRAAAHPDTLSLNEHLASKGGLRPDPELKAIYGGDRGPFLPGFGPLIRKSGMSLDEALSSAKQHGYLSDPHDAENGTAGSGGRTSHGLTPNDLLDKLDAENRGQKLYKQGHLEATKYDPEQEKHVIMGALESELHAAGEDVSAIDPKLLNRAVEIVHREGETDVMAAYERAIMEDAESYDAIANARRSDPATADIPGWDKPADAGTAPGDGGLGAADRRQAGRPEQGAGGSDGQKPPGNGGRNLAAAAADPRWRELADARPAVDDPAVVAESKAADQVKEPDSLVPETALTAAERAAADAEVVWRKLEPTLTEDERALVNGVLDQLKLDKEARSKIITEGAACLAAAVI